MSHEVVQVIKLIKYNRKLHEIISVTCKRIPTTVNKEVHKNEHSHEMTQFRNWIAVWSSLHEPVLIYGSSHESVFESPMYWVYNEHESESGPDLLQWSGSHKQVRNAVARNQTHELKQTYTCTRIHSTTYTHKHTCTPAYIRIQVYAYTNIHAYISKLINTYY